MAVYPAVWNTPGMLYVAFGDTLSQVVSEAEHLQGKGSRIAIQQNTIAYDEQLKD